MRHIHKFGGSSLADADCYLKVAALVRRHCQKGDLVVVSASGDTTDLLLNLSPQSLPALAGHQRALLQGVEDAPLQARLEAALAEDLAAIEQALAQGQGNSDWLLTFGEIWSARLLAGLLGARFLDAREFLVIEGGLVQPQSRERLKALVTEELTVVTGFIGADSAGQTRTLGRNGSDYSATLVGGFLEAASVTIWTDVSGIYTADPRKLEGAYTQSQLAGNVATELARLGSPVLHPRTLTALDLTRQQLFIRCTFAPDEGGTRISTERANKNLASLTWRQGIYRCQLSAANPALQAQAYAVEEGGLVLYLPFAHGDNAEQLTLLALVGQGLDWQSPAGQALANVAQQGGLVHQAKGPDGLSLIAFIRQLPAKPLLARLHDQLFAVGVVVLGLGNIGGCWLDGFAPRLKDRLRLYGLANSKQQLFDLNGIAPGNWRSEFAQRGEPRVEGDLLAAFKQAPFAHLLLLDLTASKAVAQQYPQWLNAGIHLVSANKQAGSAPLGEYDRLHVTLRQSGRRWFYNTTVGAGLPVQAAIRDLLGCGDDLEGVGGIFSGTLCWLFQNFDGTKPFSELVKEAHAKGFTEPDPRDDLNGLDAARKLLILAREAGWRLELDNIHIDNLVPEHLRDISRDEFFARLDELDAPLLAALNGAKAQGKVLRYIGNLRQEADGFRATVGLEALDASHPFASLTPGDNIFAIQSRYYRENPLIIRGPGAGPHVTAAGVQSDVIQLLAWLA
ncbi:bifunctional aspartate kinase II/homoserine dehydrogenase II [Gallaecimonas xiamenensis]|uniref:homoserine dehydrogenase n=1 Tax=Gallaecimonas xiamenensis 3-C-1 TaxID=745411 RepID=K2JRA5_9GAMM|nr:bifunctional aspartate kinase II/homoserine dehydrogenase II [Gallaecimonas xiamenensis]EKE77052.1 bifunctional aspartate kinase II/homoserine dehydrogenase II [Gallaecimonas xiamenensis 3-C-1]